jgi:hypothetical protein
MHFTTLEVVLMVGGTTFVLYVLVAMVVLFLALVQNLVLHQVLKEGHSSTKTDAVIITGFVFGLIFFVWGILMHINLHELGASVSLALFGFAFISFVCIFTLVPNKMYKTPGRVLTKIKEAREKQQLA